MVYGWKINHTVIEGRRLKFHMEKQLLSLATELNGYCIIILGIINFNFWDEVFYDATIASAILDRILHHAHVISISGKSYSE